jgi:hypothetical protein
MANLVIIGTCLCLVGRYTPLHKQFLEFFEKNLEGRPPIVSRSGVITENGSTIEAFYKDLQNVRGLGTPCARPVCADPH